MFKIICRFGFVALLLFAGIFFVAARVPGELPERHAGTNAKLRTEGLIGGLFIPLLAAEGGQPNEIYRPSFGTQAQLGKIHYLVGIHPLHNPKRLFEIYGPIVDYLNATIPDAAFTLEASRNYDEFDKKLYNGYFDFALPNPYQCLEALKHGYRIFGKMADDQDFRGLIIVRRDSAISTLADLKGKAVAYPAPSALAATLMPQYYLHTHGIDINRDVENRYVGSQESSIINVLWGHVAAGATWTVPWKIYAKEHPDLAGQLEVKWQTKPLQNNGWVVRKNVPAEIANNVAERLFALDRFAEGRKLLARIPVSRFEPANDNTYGPVRKFLDTFSKAVRPLE